MSTTHLLVQPPKPDYINPRPKNLVASTEDAPDLGDQSPDTLQLSVQDKVFVKQRPYQTEEQAWFLRYHFYQSISAVKTPLPIQPREIAVVKLRELIRGASAEALQLIPGKSEEQKEPTLAEHSLAMLAAYGTGDDVQLCLNQGIRPDAYEFLSLKTPTTLMRAVANRNLETMQVLLPHLTKADLAKHNFYGHTALDIALRQFFGNADPVIKKQDEAILKTLKTAYGPIHYLKRYWHHKLAPTPQPDDFEEFNEESALPIS